MEEYMFKNAIVISKDIIKRKIEKGSIVVDATIGNGNDVLFLCSLVGKKGEIYGFDIQQKAIDNTFAKVKEYDYSDRVFLFKDSHEHIDRYIREPVDLIIYNLGYMPGGDHGIITKPDSTIRSLKKSLNLLKRKAIILVTAYSGHKGGKEEKEAVENFIAELNQKEFNAIKFDFLNQKNEPPTLFAIEKI